MGLRLNGSTSGYVELNAPAVAGAQVLTVPTDFGFASGTVMLFQQTSAPTGWTKLTTHNDKALRIVSGTVGSGGATAFSAVMNGSVNATTLTTSQIPSHTHNFTARVSASGGGVTSGSIGIPNSTQATANAGGGDSHTHSMDVAYVDVIMASKD
jgi:hypothetical protein